MSYGNKIISKLFQIVSNCFITFVFRSSDVRHLLLDVNPGGGIDPLGMFPHSLKRTADGPHLIAVFRQLLCMSSFPVCRRQFNVNQIPKTSSSSSVENY